MSRRFENVSQVVSWRLCLGCGVCVRVCPEGALTLIDVEDDGLRPNADVNQCAHCGECLKVCPGIAIAAPEAHAEAIPELRRSWGNVLEIWEGYASDPDIRFQGSSGGVATALSLCCIEKLGMRGVLHIGPDETDPLANTAVVSRERAGLLERTGSRYAPAAPCLGLDLLNEKGASYVFVGKPCDVVALRKWQEANPEAGRHVALAVSIFCAGTPSTQGTKKVLEELNVASEGVRAFRYRGCGWPGRTVAQTSEDDTDHSMSYEESWGNILSRHTQFRCRLCPDSTGELADISCGDPWYREIEPGDPGRSLVLVRTEKGKRILREAMKADYVQLEQVDPNILPQSQRSLLKRRQHLWGRLLAMHLFRVPVPYYCGFSLSANWWSARASEKARSLFGTIRRIQQRKWNVPLKPESAKELSTARL